MKPSRWIALLAVAALAGAGCQTNSLRPERGRLALGGGSIDARQRDARRAGTECGDLPTAPESLRVDLGTPVFSNSTAVTNPLFPISQLDRVLLLGQVDGGRFRVETTLMPGTRRILVDGREVEVLISQYIAWIDRRIEEVALDWYAQADDGSVWYLGEDVFNYDEGVIEDTNGTWLAGRDGPMAMIMPANPRVGDVWRPENICGFVFEEVAATATGVTVAGPAGPVSGALVVKELHMDGTYEDKTFAPGYGEFFTGSGADVEAVALAVPTDRLGGSVPAELETLDDGAEAIFTAAKHGRWEEAAALRDAMASAWSAFRGSGVPPRIEAEMERGMAALGAAVAARSAADTRQASVDVALSTLDLALRHRPRAEIDAELIEVWARQLAIDAKARDRGAVLGDLATIKWIRERGISKTDGAVDLRIDGARAAAGTAISAVDFDRLEAAADQLGSVVRTGAGGGVR